MVLSDFVHEGFVVPTEQRSLDDIYHTYNPKQILITMTSGGVREQRQQIKNFFDIFLRQRCWTSTFVGVSLQSTIYTSTEQK